jgi:ParB family chromosome partitioning protein
MNDQAPIIGGDLRLIPLADLALSPLNTRQQVAEEEIEAMAESIAIAGLLQNLIGIETAAGSIEIVGGGKRLRALQKLAGEGWSRKTGQTRIDPVPVKVTSDPHRAIAWSGTENTARSELHPADEVRAYAAMRERGSSAQMIARSFAKSEAHVERRLRLADLPAPVLDALRANEITYEIAKVLTITPTEARCLEALQAVRGRDTRPDMLGRELTPDTVPLSDRRARYVGLEAYVAAGGTYQSDLFTESGYLHDEKLLNELFIEKGKAETEALRVEEGWKWAEFTAESYRSYTLVQNMEWLRREPVELTEADAEEYDRLTSGSDELSKEDEDRLDALEERMKGDFTDVDRETGGIFCFVDRDGFQVDRAYRRREDVADDAGAGDGQVTSKKGAEEDAAAFPQNLQDDLKSIKLLALQTRLMDQPKLMLDLLAWTLMGGLSPWSKPLAVSISPPSISPTKPEGTTISERLAAVTKAESRGEDPTPAAFEAFRDLGEKHRNKVLAEALARTFQGTGPLAETLAAQLDVNTRSVWSPTAAGFLGRTSSAYLDSIWERLVPADKIDLDNSAYRGLKRAEKAKRLQALFDDMSVREAIGLSRAEAAKIDDWLPDELRWKRPAKGGEEGGSDG